MVITRFHYTSFLLFQLATSSLLHAIIIDTMSEGEKGKEKKWNIMLLLFDLCAQWCRVQQSFSPIMKMSFVIYLFFYSSSLLNGHQDPFVKNIIEACNHAEQRVPSDDQKAGEHSGDVGIIILPTSQNNGAELK